jgi:hypothetical protein
MQGRCGHQRIRRASHSRARCAGVFGRLPCTRSHSGGRDQRHQDGERPGPSRERPRDEPRHHAPRMTPAIGRIVVRRSPPITMPSLAKDLGAGGLGHRILARQEPRARRDDIVQQVRDHGASQRPGRPSARGPHARIGRPMPVPLRLNGASQVGDGPSPRGQESGEHQDEKPVIRGSREHGPKHGQPRHRPSWAVHGGRPSMGAAAA